MCNKQSNQSANIMEKPPELEIKYQKLATEYTKLKSQAMVLKKAVVDEQAKNADLKEALNSQEQKLRKFHQETESLTFRNEQLTKRVSVLQQELQVNSFGKKSKSKNHEHPAQNNFSVLDEELQHKIMENASLFCAISDKDAELSDNQAMIESLQSRLVSFEHEISDLNKKHRVEIDKVKNSSSNSLDLPNAKLTCKNCDNPKPQSSKTKDKVVNWQVQAEKYKTEYEILKNQPRDNKAAVDYYETQVRRLLSKTSLAESESKSLWIEINSLSARLDECMYEKHALESILEKTAEELSTSNSNYQSQLDAMTEHLASQNDKIAQQSDEIEVLKHTLSLKK